MGRPVAPLQLGHVRHRGVTLVVGVDDAVLTVLQTSGCPLGSVPQVGVDQAHWDGHHCKYDEQSQDGQGPARVLQVSFGSLDNTGGKAVSESTSTNGYSSSRCDYTMTYSMQKKTHTTPTVQFTEANPLYLLLVPGDVSGIFNEHFDDGGAQQPQHGQQADVLPQVLVDDAGTPA